MQVYQTCVLVMIGIQVMCYQLCYYLIYNVAIVVTCIVYQQKAVVDEVVLVVVI